MFELFKKRDFNALFSDTIDFFKRFGKNYYKNYFIINGIFLMILVVLIYFISKIFLENAFSTVQDSNNDFIANYVHTNPLMFFGFFAIFILVSIFLSLLNITYPIVYLSLIDKNQTEEISSSQVIVEIRKNIGRFILFFIGTIFIILPIVIIILTILILLCFVLIGIPLLIIIFPFFSSWFSQSYFIFTIEKHTFIDSLKKGYQLVRPKFWMVVGNALFIQFIIQMIQSTVTIVFYIIAFFGFLFFRQDIQNETFKNSNFSLAAVCVTLVFVILVIFGYVLNNITIINQGILYYSLREETENKSIKNEIDSIGNEL
jgi:hypothetical protein